MTNQNFKQNGDGIHSSSDVVMEIEENKYGPNEDASTIKNYLRLIRDRNTRFIDKLASELFEIGQKVTEEDLGIEKFTKSKNERLKMEIFIVEIDDEKGQVEIKVNVSIEEITSSKNIKISLFGKADKQNLLKLRDLMKQINDTTTAKNDILPIQIVNQIRDLENVKSEEIGIIKINFDDDVNILYQIIKANSELGQLEIKVILSIVKSKSQISKNIKVFGYKIQFIHDQEIVNLFQSLFPLVMQTNKKHVLPNKIINENKFYDDLGIEHPRIENKDNIEFTYVINAINNDEGTLNALIIFQKNRVTNYKQIKISGYKTTSQYEKEQMNQIQEYFMAAGETFKTSHSQTLPSSIGNKNEEVSYQQLGIGQHLQKVLAKKPFLTFTITDTNDLEGKISIKILSVLGKNSQTLTREVEGFKTLRMHYQDQVDYVMGQIIMPLKTSKNEILPSDIKSSTTHDALGIDDINDKKGAMITYEIVDGETNDEQGTIGIKITIKKCLQDNKPTSNELLYSVSADKKDDNIISAAKNFKIVNYKTRAMQDRDDVLSIIAKIEAWKLQSDKSIQPKDVADENVSWQSLKVNQQPTLELNNATMNLQIKGRDDDAGTINVLATIIKGQTTMEKVLLIKNYQTDADVNEEIWQLANKIPSNISTRLADKLPSEIV